MPDKYQLTETTNDSGYFQIQAIADFGDVLTGDLGGYVESVDNLSQSGTCWVYENAQVYGAAQVSGSAKVSGFASVYGDAAISGNAQILGNARVQGGTISGNAIVRGHAVVNCDATDNAQILDYAFLNGGSVSDNAVVQENARVFDTAQIYGNAKVSDNATLGDACTVYGDARVFGNARVMGNASVYGTAKVAGDAVLVDSCSVFDNANVGGQVVVDGVAEISGNTRLNRYSYIYLAAPLTPESEVRSILASGGDVWNFDEDVGGPSVGLFNGLTFPFIDELVSLAAEPSPLLNEAKVANTSSHRISATSAMPEYFNGNDFLLTGFYKITGTSGVNFMYGQTYNYTVSYVYLSSSNTLDAYVYNNQGDSFTGSCDIPESAADTWTQFWIKRTGNRYQMYFGGSGEIDITVTGSVDFSADVIANPSYATLDLVDGDNGCTVSVDQFLYLPTTTFTTDVLSWWGDNGTGRILEP